MTTLTPSPARPTSRLSRWARTSLTSNPILNAATWPHGVESYRDAYRPAAGVGRNAATVVALQRRTHRAVSVTLRPEQPIVWSAGQHVLVTTEVDGVRLTRCYSFSDAAETRPDGTIEITVAHLPDGRVSSHITQDLAIGEVVGLSAPQGVDFVLPGPASPRAPKRLILVGGGSGITPLRAMWRAMDAAGAADRVCILYYARSTDDAIFLDELHDLACAHVVTTRGPQSGAIVSGRFDSSHLDVFSIDPVGADTFACGPVGLVEAIGQEWTRRGAAAGLRTESFAPPVAPAAANTAADSSGHLTFTRSGASAANDGRTLLDQAEAAGLSPEAGCRMGICHTCTTTKLAGTTKDIRTGQLNDAAGCEVQLCVSAPVGDVALDC